MKKIIIATLTILNLYAAPVSIEDVSLIANNVLQNKFSNDTQYVIDRIESVVELGNELIHIVHIDPVGFVIIAADDRVYPLLGYSMESDFTGENFPVQFEAMFESYKDQIAIAVVDNIDRDVRIENAWESYKNNLNISRDDRAVSPLLMARWDQGNPYNDMCPEDQNGPGGNALVGCVAVSMVQVMHYWSYPEYGVGSHSYYHWDYGTLSANFNTFYDFDNMPTNIGTEAVQLLSYHAGVAVEMGYGADGSGAWVGSGYPCAMTAMREHFLYNDDMQFRYKSSYSWNNWRNLLKSELDSGRPLIYRGYSNSGGHAWNIDGYDDDLFHNNWGWGGSYNGFYYINELNPGGDSFTGDMAVIVDIQPESLTGPNLVLNGHFYNEVSGDMDAVLNPGESAQVFVTINNLIPWPEASNIDVYLTSDNNEISIINGSFVINNISSGGEYINGDDPFLIYVSPDAQIQDYTLGIIITGFAEDGSIYTEEFPLTLSVSLDQTNFPVLTEMEIIGSPISIDIDNNGSSEEIIYADNSGMLHLLNSDATERNNWPFNLGDDVWGSPAIADLDNDGILEIVITSKSKSLFILDPDANIEGEFTSSQFLMGTPVIGDVDSDDFLEIVFAGFTSSGDVFAVNHDGSIVDGFPSEVNEKIRSGAALYDIDMNGKDDMIFATESENLILVVYDDGSHETIFSSNSKFKNAPSVLNNNEEISIFIGNDGGEFFNMDLNGNINFIYSASGAVKTAASFNTFNNLDAIFFGTENGYLYAIDQYGNDLDGWPVIFNGSINSTPSFADLNNDGNAEIITSTASGNIIVLNIDGTDYGHFPINYQFGTNSAPMISDIDLDSDLELIFGMTGGLAVFDIKDSGSDVNYWSMYRGDAKRSGVYMASSNNQSLGDLNSDMVLDILDIVITINIILEEIDPNNYEQWAGDLNSDSIIDILDIVMLINLILE